MNEREKIIKIVREAKWRDMFGDHHGICEPQAEAIADALLANGIGDVAAWKEKYEKMSLVTKLYSNAGTTEIERLTRERDEYKRRAEVAESELEKHKRALRIAAPRLKCYGGWGKGFCSIQGCEYHHCENAEGCVAAHLREASRRIEEERK